MIDYIHMDMLIHGMARALWVVSWADQMEEEGECFSGQDLMDVAPPYPPSTELQAAFILGLFCSANKTLSPAVIIHKVFSVNELDTDDETLIENFGHYIVMEMLSTGVGWSDNYPGSTNEIEFPYIEKMVIG